MRMLEKHKMLYPLLVGDLQAFDVTPAAKWFLTENEREQYDIVDDFHRLIAPYPRMWLEFEHPPVVYSAETGQTRVSPHSVGVLIETMELPEDFTEKVLPALVHGHNVQMDLLNSGLTREAKATFSDEVCYHPELIRKIANGEKLRWFTIWGGFTSSSMMRSPITIDGCTHFVMRAGFVSQHGRLMPNFIVGSPILPFLPKSKHKEFIDAAGSSLLPFAFAIQLLHCKNVETNAASIAQKVKEKREKRGVPSVEYKILSVAPLRKAIQVEREAVSGTSVRKALHFARGHFKDFSQGKGLFGKHKGLYWWHDQVRGDVAQGVIDKDYRVKP